MQQNKKKATAQENIYEAMEDQKLFLKIRDDLLYSKTGIQLEELLDSEDRNKFISEVNTYIKRIYRISDEKLNRFDAYILSYIFEFHVLTELMKDAEISDIKVLSWDNIRIKRLGKRISTDKRFWSKEDFRGFVEMIAVKNGINTGMLNAIQTFTDKKSSHDFIFRFNISTGAINSTGEPYLHIRKIPKKKMSAAQLMKAQMLTVKMLEYLKQKQKEGYLVICGSNGAGKTYLLNALLDEIPHEESVLVVQENEELFTDIHPDMMFQHIWMRRGDNRVHYSLKELVINGLLTDIDHMVIGEIKGEEALYFISAALSGCNGITTIHSNDAKGALDKLADYCKWGSNYSREEIYKLLSCVKTIVYVDDFKIQEIVENKGWNEIQKRNELTVCYDRAGGVDRL